jgi:hypothetical protein
VSVVVEGEHASLARELAHMRVLLEAYRAGEPAHPLESQPSDFEPTIDRLARLFELSAFERQLLLLAAAVELDGDLALLVAELQGADDPRPTFGLALAALPGAHWDALAPGSPLRHWRLLEPETGHTLATRPLRIDERVLHLLAGIEGSDERLAGVVHVAPVVPLAPSQGALATELARTVAAVNVPVLVSIGGEDADAGLGVAQELGVALGLLPLYVRGGAEASCTRFLDREVLLVGGLPVLEDVSLAPLLESPIVVALGNEDAPAGGRLVLRRTVALPDAAEQHRLWLTALGEADAIEEVAQHVRLSAAAIDGVARELAAAPDSELMRLCRERARIRLDGLAQRIDPAATWDDLVLPAAHLELLQEILRHVRHRTQVYERWGFADRTSRGLGVTALFAGESGTGKTLAAEVIAHELGLDLYRIDLATTVSKYIGETEKNLATLFAAAEASGAVLLFDEADALFGKRGEVKDGHDRYANLEVAYLLQRMESYRGLAILTTNLRSNVDRAFLRRLGFVVQFPFPDAEQRAEIWRKSFPAAAPLDGIDFDALARLAAPGGSIRAMALSAAFGAADDGTAVTAAHVLRAARVEYAKTERALTETETEGLR